MRYWVQSALGIGLFLGSVVLFNLELVALLDQGTCASGNQPFEVSQPCAEGTEVDGLLLVASIFGLLISAGIFLTRGYRPGGRSSVAWIRSSFQWTLLAWGVFFAAAGAVALAHALSSEAVESDGELGGIIVGVIFLVMGLPALIFSIARFAAGKHSSEEARVLGER